MISPPPGPPTSLDSARDDLSQVEGRRHPAYIV